MDLQGNLVFGGLLLARKRSNFTGIPPVFRKTFNGNLAGVFNKTFFGKNYPTVVEFNKDLDIVSQSSINYSQPGIDLFGKDICFSGDGTPILVGTSNGGAFPFFAKMNSI